MQNKILAVAAIVGAMGVAFTAHAQQRVIVEEGTTTGMVSGSVGISDELRPRFREYVVQERVPDYVVEDRVSVGTILPDVGVTYYDVPQQYGVADYRYTHVNGRYVLVEPRTRRVIQVID